MTNVERYVRMAQEKENLEFELFASEGGDGEEDFLDDQIFELEARMMWLWDEMTPEECEQVEELL
jgi:hypothetical protein